MNLEKRTVRNKVWWIAGAILLPLLLFLALGAQDQVASYSVFKVPAVSAYYFISIYLPISTCSFFFACLKKNEPKRKGIRQPIFPLLLAPICP